MPVRYANKSDNRLATRSFLEGQITLSAQKPQAAGDLTVQHRNDRFLQPPTI